MGDTRQPEFGQRVTVTARFVRRWRAASPRSRKVWERLDGFTVADAWKSQRVESREGIFLGYRTLADGHVTNYYDEGTIFEAEHHFKAALVCLSEREKPVYVPLDAMLPTPRQPEEEATDD